MSRTTVFIALVLAGCSGSGVSTTARESFGGTGDMMTTATPSSTDPSTSGEPASSDESDPSATTMPAEETTATSGPSSEESGPPSTDTGVPVELEGGWFSEGDDVAPILVEAAAVVRIDAVFADGTFTVTTLDAEGNEVVQAGVYASTPSGVGEIFDIVLEQSSPQAITVEGIYEIDNSTSPPTMTYEVVQTVPSVGAVPPTADGGFGSTSLGADLTQRYVRL